MPIIRVTECLVTAATITLTIIQFWFLQEARKLDPAFDPFKGKENRYEMFDKVCGSDMLRSAMMSDFNFGKLMEFWNQDVDRFRKLSGPYYLYK